MELGAALHSSFFVAKSLGELDHGAHKSQRYGKIQGSESADWDNVLPTDKVLKLAFLGWILRFLPIICETSLYSEWSKFNGS
jgi:hypothetical protein